MDRTKIEWTDATWNPLRGCSRVSEGCRNCYAERVAARFSGPGLPYEGLAEQTPAGPRWTGKVRFVSELIDQPLSWQRPRRIFVNSMSDLFHDEVRESTIHLIWAVMALAPRHTFQILTKRPARMAAMLNATSSFYGGVNEAARFLTGKPIAIFPTQKHGMVASRWPLPNVWLGVSIEDQAAAEERIPPLLRTPAAVRWISAEPLLGPLDLKVAPVGQWPDGSRWMANKEEHDDWKYWMHRDNGLTWVVVGGESGPEARAMHPGWARSIRDQCRQAAVGFFFKQWGEWAPGTDSTRSTARGDGYVAPDGGPLPGPALVDGQIAYAYSPRELEARGCALVARVGKSAAGRMLDGRTWDEAPNGQPTFADRPRPRKQHVEVVS